MRGPLTHFGPCVPYWWRPKGGELPEDNSSFAGVSTSIGMTDSFLYCERSDTQLDRYLKLCFQGHDFSLSRLAISRSPTAIGRHELVTPSSSLFAPPVSCPSPDVNGGIDLLAIGLSD